MVKTDFSVWSFVKQSIGKVTIIITIIIIVNSSFNSVQQED